jgi:uncharacterized membrane protein
MRSRFVSDALKQNINPRNEIDKMFAKALEESNRLNRCIEERTNEMRRESDAKVAAIEKSTARFEKALIEDRARHDQIMIQAELNFQKAMTRYLITTISVLGSLIMVFSTLTVFSQHLLAITK